MRIAAEGWPFIRIGLALDAALLVIWYAWPGWTIAFPVVGALLTAWLFVFFRDPVREGPRGDHVVIAPADGRVCSIAQVEEPMYLHDKATRVSIFMNVLNVHVNRYPVSGEIEIVHYNPGEFTVASHDKASLVNEQASVGIASPSGRVLVRQIAGLIARRIVTDGGPGDRAVQGERMGMIRFGSRVDVFLESAAKMKVSLGEAVYAGRTVIAERGA
ncbi:MAG: phosphatidylserine decarboxylase family protein [Gemmatimonadetes bacterium]|nr:phosphatidylserine decarboxylase family protein [Gemmatimonadota bacterium]